MLTYNTLRKNIYITERIQKVAEIFDRIEKDSFIELGTSKKSIYKRWLGDPDKLDNITSDNAPYIDYYIWEIMNILGEIDCDDIQKVEVVNVFLDWTIGELNIIFDGEDIDDDIINTTLELSRNKIEKFKIKSIISKVGLEKIILELGLKDLFIYIKDLEERPLILNIVRDKILANNLLEPIWQDQLKNIKFEVLNDKLFNKSYLKQIDDFEIQLLKYYNLTNK